MVLDSIRVQKFYYLTIAWVEISLLLKHIDNKKKYILILGKSPTQRIDQTVLTAEAQYSINFSRLNRKFCLSPHYNGSNNFLFFNATKINECKAKDPEIKKCPLCLGNISGNSSPSNTKNRIKWMCV